LQLTDAGEIFRQNEILLVGANGFLGKVLVGLLLDRFPDFRHLHILIRSRSNKQARERFDAQVLASPALSAIVQKFGPEFLNDKLSILAADIGESDCGLAAADIERMRGRVGLILNCAGLVEFFPPVDDSFRSNVDGVEHLVALAKTIRAKLLHVSTCYVCGEAEGLVEETEPIVGFYPHRKGRHDKSFDHRAELAYCRERIRQIRDSSSDGVHSKQVEQRLTELGKQRAARWGWVNTYTYSKSLGEQIIAAEAGFEYAIVRPAIVESALQFPFPGWVEGGRTAAPLVMMARGGLRHWTVRRDAPLEVIPVDLVASAILVVSALLLDGRSRRVYQLGTADVNPILLEPLVKLLCGVARVRFVSAEAAKTRRIRVQKTVDRAQRVISGVRQMLKSTGLPGKRALSSLGMSLRALGLQAAYRQQTLELYQPFILDNRFIFEAENIRAGSSLLPAKDRERLPWNPEQIDWKQYWLNNQIQGIETWIQPDAVKHWKFHV
jgi:long-chain acyl-CoA synthetase